MSQDPPQDPPYQSYPVYQSGYRPYGSAPTLAKLSGIFNCIMAAIDIIYALCIATFAILLATGVIPKEVFEDHSVAPIGAPAPPPAPAPPMALISGVIGAFAAVAFVAGLVKIVGGVKILRRTRGAWGWSLAGGIVGCTQLWCSYLCVLPLAVGVFTIVVCCLENVRQYLRDSRGRHTPTAAAPVKTAHAVPPPVVPAPGGPAPPIVFAPGAPPPEWLFIAMYGTPGALSLLVVGPKLFGAITMLRGRKRAWGWGLATGIICCCEWWMITPCCALLIVPLGAGIFTIVVHCLPHVRAYYADRASRLNATSP